jgi:hypothetical protein
VKQSRIKRLISKKLARRIAGLEGDEQAELAQAADKEALEVIARMRTKGYRLITRLENGEGVFVREDGLVGMHVQLPSSLYKRLEAECRSRETTKRNVIIAALEQYLEERS